MPNAWSIKDLSLSDGKRPVSLSVKGLLLDISFDEACVTLIVRQWRIGKLLFTGILLCR